MAYGQPPALPSGSLFLLDLVTSVFSINTHLRLIPGIPQVLFGSERSTQQLEMQPLALIKPPPQACLKGLQWRKQSFVILKRENLFFLHTQFSEGPWTQRRAKQLFIFSVATDGFVPFMPSRSKHSSVALTKQLLNIKKKSWSEGQRQNRLSLLPGEAGQVLFLD